MMILTVHFWDGSHMGWSLHPGGSSYESEPTELIITTSDEGMTLTQIIPKENVKYWECRISPDESETDEDEDAFGRTNAERKASDNTK